MKHGKENEPGFKNFRTFLLFFIFLDYGVDQVHDKIDCRILKFFYHIRVRHHGEPMDSRSFKAPSPC